MTIHLPLTYSYLSVPFISIAKPYLNTIDIGDFPIFPKLLPVKNSWAPEINHRSELGL